MHHLPGRPLALVGVGKMPDQAQDVSPQSSRLGFCSRDPEGDSYPATGPSNRFHRSCSSFVGPGDRPRQRDQTPLLVSPLSAASNTHIAWPCLPLRRRVTPRLLPGRHGGRPWRASWPLRSLLSAPCCPQRPWQGIGEVGASVLDRCGTMAGQWDSSPEGHPPGIAAKADPAQILNP